MQEPADIQKLRQAFVEMGMPGMVALIDHLLKEESEGKHVECVGSSTIDLHNLMECKNMSEKEIFETVFFRLQSLRFGRKGRTPLEDIADSFDALVAAPLEARKKIDEIVAQFAVWGDAAAKHLDSLHHDTWSGNEPANSNSEYTELTLEDIKAREKKLLN